MLAQSAPAGPPDRLPTGVWKPIAGSGLAERAVNACVSADRLVLTLEPAAGEGPPVSQLAVPFGAASGHPIDAVASVAMGSSSSGRVEAVAVKTAADVRSVLAVFPDGRSQRAAVVDGWAVLAVALEGKPHGVVEVTAMGRTGGVLERVSVPASGSLALRPVVCHPLVPPAVSGTPTSLPIAGSSGVSAGS